MCTSDSVDAIFFLSCNCGSIASNFCCLSLSMVSRFDGSVASYILVLSSVYCATIPFSMSFVSESYTLLLCSFVCFAISVAVVFPVLSSCRYTLDSFLENPIDSNVSSIV